MTKSTLFTVFLSGLMMVVMTEMLVDKYWASSGHLNADVFTSDVAEKQPLADNSPETLQVIPSEEIFVVPKTQEEKNPLFQPIQKIILPQTQQGLSVTLETFPEKQSSLPPPPKTESFPAKISLGMVQKAGFGNVSLLRIPFDGFLFKHLALKDSISLPVTMQHVMQDSSKRMATFYEFDTKSQLLAGQVFLALREKFLKLKESSVNPTGEFQMSAFYVNFEKEPKIAFLVVKKGGNVYALTYQKESHPLIQKLLPLLP